MTLNPGELLLYESARLPHGRTSFLRQVCTWYNFGLQCLFFIYGLGLLVTPFLCQWFVEQKDKTGLNPYHNKYLFLSEGRASPIYLCIFVQRQVGFQCICNWKKNHFSSKAGFRRIGSLCMPVLSPVDAVYINVRENILLCETDFGCNVHTILH